MNCLQNIQIIDNSDVNEKLSYTAFSYPFVGKFFLRQEMSNECTRAISERREIKKNVCEKAERKGEEREAHEGSW